MRERFHNVLSTPRLLGVLIIRAAAFAAQRLRSTLALTGVSAVLILLLSLCTMALWHALGPQRGAASFREGDFGRSAAIFESFGTPEARYNAANAFYRAGEYERALQLYSALEPEDTAMAARIWFNRGNTLIRLKEYAKARDAFARSLAFQYDDAALENMMRILHSEEQDHMLTGRQEGKKRAQDQEESGGAEGNKKKAKEGGGSEQQSQAERNSGAGGDGKKTERETQLEFSDKGGSRLSSKQYELINERSVHETNPW